MDPNSPDNSNPVVVQPSQPVVPASNLAPTANTGIFENPRIHNYAAVILLAIMILGFMGLGGVFVAIPLIIFAVAGARSILQGSKKQPNTQPQKPIVKVFRVISIIALTVVIGIVGLMVVGFILLANSGI